MSGGTVTHEPSVLADFFVPGPPHSQKPWVSRVIDAALGQPRVMEKCELEVEFVLSPDRVAWILPSEPSLANMLRALLEALEDTVLRGASEEGGGLVALRARTKVSDASRPPGTRIVIRRASTPP